MKKKHLKEIQRISKSIPQHLLDQLTHKELQFPTLKEIVVRALSDPEAAHLLSDEDRVKYKAMLDSGSLDSEVEVLNHDIEAQIDKYLEGEFEKARKLGRLPPPQKMPTLKTKSKRIYVEQSKKEDIEVEDNKKED